MQITHYFYSSGYEHRVPKYIIGFLDEYLEEGNGDSWKQYLNGVLTKKEEEFVKKYKKYSKLLSPCVFYTKDEIENIDSDNDDKLEIIEEIKENKLFLDLEKLTPKEKALHKHFKFDASFSHMHYDYNNLFALASGYYKVDFNLDFDPNNLKNIFPNKKKFYDIFGDDINIAPKLEKALSKKHGILVPTRNKPAISLDYFKKIDYCAMFDNTQNEVVKYDDEKGVLIFKFDAESG